VLGLKFLFPRPKDSIPFRGWTHAYCSQGEVVKRKDGTTQIWTHYHHHPRWLDKRRTKLKKKKEVDFLPKRKGSHSGHKVYKMPPLEDCKEKCVKVVVIPP